MAITIIPPFFTDFIAVSVTMSAGANTIAASNRPCFSFKLFRNSSCCLENIIVSVAPNLFATSRWFCVLENAMTLHFSTLANCTAMWPTPPIPNMPIFFPMFGSAAFTALYAVIPAQNNGAAYPASMLFGTFVAKSSVTVMYSE